MREVEISEIDRELTELWREAAPDAGGSASQAGGTAPAALMRACALNLVVAGFDPGMKDIMQTLHEVTMRHPCRSIVLLTDDSDARPPRAWVNMVCHPGGRGQPEVCSEQLVLAGRSDALHELVAAVAGLLVPDLPTFLWWRGRPPQPGTESERFEHLSDVADRILLDSLRYDAAQFARAVELLHETRSERPPRCFGDVNWARLTGWRAAIAGCFDTPANREQLATMDELRIMHDVKEAGSAPPASSRLMAGWLRSRLKQPLAVKFIPAAAGVLELHSMHACFRVARPAPPADSAALAEELQLTAHDPVFEAALLAGVQ